MTSPVAKMDESRLRRLMQDDEDERLEFKMGMINRSEITEYAVGIGNEGGGWLILGVTNKKPRRIAAESEDFFGCLSKKGRSFPRGSGGRAAAGG